MPAAIQRGLVLTEHPIDIDVDASAYQAQSAEYWQHVLTSIRQQVRMLQARPESDRAIALYGLADMPALMLMGFAIGHAAELYPFQWDRYAHSCRSRPTTSPPWIFTLIGRRGGTGRSLS